MFNSANGLTWDKANALGLPSGFFSGIEHGNGRFVGISIADTVPARPVSTLLDETNAWVKSVSIDPTYGVSFTGGMFAVLSTGQFLASIDGLNWRTQATGFPVALYDLVIGNDWAVAVGADGTILQSGSMVAGPRSFQLRNPRRANGIFRASIEAEAGVTYLLESKNTLDATSWTPVQTVIGQGATLELSDSSATTQQRFYRVRTL